MIAEQWDTVVVGAGPAGTAAAIALASAGHRVALLDKAEFPRDKPCGDLIGDRAMTAARALGIDERVLSAYPRLLGANLTTSRGELDLAPRTALGRSLTRDTDARVIPRSVFDAAMVDAAVRAGAVLRRAHVRRITNWDGSRRTIDAIGAGGSVTIQSPLVILAAGYGSRVLAGLARDADTPARGIAMRAYFSNVRSPRRRVAFTLNEWILPGYGWVFPLPDGGANVGIGTLVSGEGEPEHLRELFRRYTADPASPAAGWLSGASQTSRPRSWPLDLGPRDLRVVTDGLLLAGEAAGLVGPLTGAGIAFALRSGRFAGACAAGALAAVDTRGENLIAYERHLRRRFHPWLRAELTAQRWLSDPSHMSRLFRITKPLPPTGAVGARILLHLG